MCPPMRRTRGLYRAKLFLCLEADVGSDGLVNMRGGGIRKAFADHPEAATVDLKLVIWESTEAPVNGRRALLAIEILGPSGDAVMRGDVQRDPHPANAPAGIVAPLKGSFPFGRYAIRLLEDGQVVDEVQLELARGAAPREQ